MSYIRKTHRNIKWPVTILYDDREKHPWKLSSKYKMVKRRLKTGDYTIKDFGKLVAIEKKAGLHELVTNLSGADRARFAKTLTRLQKYKYSAIVIEDSITNLDKVIAKLPKCAKIDRHSVLHWISKINVVYKIPIIFTGVKPRIKQELLEQIFDNIIKDL